MLLEKLHGRQLQAIVGSQTMPLGDFDSAAGRDDAELDDPIQTLNVLSHPVYRGEDFFD